MDRPQQATSGPRLSLVLVAAALAMAAFVAGVLWDMPLLRLVTKPLPVLALALYAATRRTRYATTLAIGLVLGAAGDVLLEASPHLFIAGLVAFLAGHVAYVVAFLDGERRVRIARALPPFAAGAAVITLLWTGLGSMLIPVTAYMLVICAMAWRSAARVDRGRTEAWLALAGAALFLASDTVLGVSRFLVPFSEQRLLVLSLSTYWAAQLLITLSATATTTATDEREQLKAQPGRRSETPAR
jgi:alkenylglycerophosphocholine/alkenylglycerophosphoethanolamine hydrolase